METRSKCTKESCYNNEMHMHGDSGEWLAGHDRYSVKHMVPTNTCQWVTANSLTDHEVRDCTSVAEFVVNDPDETGISQLCLAHADLYKTITHRMPTRIDNA